MGVPTGNKGVPTGNMGVPTGNMGVPSGNFFDHLGVSPLVTSGNF